MKESFPRQVDKKSAAAAKLLQRVQLYAIPEMAAHQAPPSLGFSRQEHWNGLPFPSQGSPRREGFGMLKEEKRTNYFFLYIP